MCVPCCTNHTTFFLKKNHCNNFFAKIFWADLLRTAQFLHLRSFFNFSYKRFDEFGAVDTFLNGVFIDQPKCASKGKPVLFFGCICEAGILQILKQLSS